MTKPSSGWIEVAQLLAAAPDATNEAEVMLDRYYAGELSADELIEALRALAVRRWSVTPLKIGDHGTQNDG